MNDAAPRYAIYFAPAATSPLWRFGSAVLGYDAETGAEVDFPPAMARAWPNWPTLTAEPRKYGLHATLKAPFRLRDGATETDLLAATKAFAQITHGCALQGLAVETIGRFVALIPVGDIALLQELAGRTVNAFEDLRAPLSDFDRARRLNSSLTPAQIANLDRYGYPYVHDEFRFHITLTGSLPAELMTDVPRQLAASFAEVVPQGPVAIDTLSIFRQDRSDARFRIIARTSLR